MLSSLSRKTVCALTVFVAVPLAAFASPITSGVYQMHNHPDGDVAAPFYGLRLDELYNATNHHDIFTFDFDNAQSNMRLTYSSANRRITIDGVAFGGRDIGNGYANDQYRGIYTIHMVYNGVQQVPGDDDLWVPGNGTSNSGTIRTPLSQTKNLSGVGMGGYSLRVGDENNDRGHRGFAGPSGWGWLSVNGCPSESMDWLFTLGAVPEPSSLLLLGLGGLSLLRRRM